MEESEQPEIDPALLPVAIPPDAITFVANGVKYVIERQHRLSVQRDIWLERFGLLCGLGRDANSFLQEDRRAFDALNANRIADAAVILDNNMRGAAEMAKNPSPFYMVCTLFINRIDENRRKYSVDLGQQKVADWEAEGIEADFFTHLATVYLSVSATQLGGLIAASLNLPVMSLETGPLSE